MQLNKAIELWNRLSESDPFFKTNESMCWQKLENKLTINILSATYSSSEELKENYAEMRDHVAISLQSQMMESDAERWNLYVFYFVKELVDGDLKQMIEQDKFSSRKIVCDQYTELTDHVISEVINRELFNFNFTKREKSEASMDDLLKRDHRLVFNALKEIEHDEDLLDNLINALTNEQNQ